MVRVTVNDHGLAERLQGAARRGADLTPAFAIAGQRLRSDTLRNFQSGGWFPEHWKPSRRGGMTLVDRATLRNSIHATTTAQSAAVGTDVKYAAVHQYGAEIRPRPGHRALRFVIDGQTIFRRSVWIPSRPFLPVDDHGNLAPGTQTFMADLFGRYVVEGRTA